MGASCVTKFASQALRQAYQDILHHQRHPAFVLFLQLHPRSRCYIRAPTKSEVRFPRARHSSIYFPPCNKHLPFRPNYRPAQNNQRIYADTEQKSGCMLRNSARPTRLGMARLSETIAVFTLWRQNSFENNGS